MNAFRELFSSAGAAYSRLNAREKRLVSLMFVTLACVLLFSLVMSFHRSAQKYLTQIEAAKVRLSEAQKLSGSYRANESKRLSFENQLKNNNVQLISYLEEKGAAAGLSIPTIYPRPETPVGESNISESTVELTLTDIRIDRLVNFLKSVEAPDGIIKVKQVRIEPRVANETLTAWVTVAAYRMKQ